MPVMIIMIMIMMMMMMMMTIIARKHSDSASLHQSWPKLPPQNSSVLTWGHLQTIIVS